MTTQALAITPTRTEAPGGAYVSDPSKATLVMGGSDFDGSPQCPGATIVVHALGDRTNSQLIFTEVTFPPGQRPWFHTHHGEDEGFYVNRPGLDGDLGYATSAIEVTV